MLLAIAVDSKGRIDFMEKVARTSADAKYSKASRFQQPIVLILNQADELIHVMARHVPGA
jgi:hypothetical protein